MLIEAHVGVSFVDLLHGEDAIDAEVDTSRLQQGQHVARAGLDQVQTLLRRPGPLKGTELTVTIDGKTTTFEGKVSGNGWVGLGVGDGRLTDSFSVQRSVFFLGTLRPAGRRHFVIWPLGGGTHALAESDPAAEPQFYPYPTLDSAVPTSREVESCSRGALGFTTAGA